MRIIAEQTAQGRIFVAESSYSEKDVVKAAGFRWNPDRRRWWTPDADKAAVLAKFADEPLKSELLAIVAAKEAALAASRATDADADLDLPCPEGLAYLPYQRAGIAYGLNHKNVLIADEMGLGKTIQLLGIVNADPSVRSVLLVVPASLKINWKREAQKWLVRPLSVAVANGGAFPTADVVIINYDILAKHYDAIRARHWDLLGIDEVHYTKNADAQRSQHVWGNEEKVRYAEYKGKKAPKLIAPIKARRIVALTGTPLLNRVIELWTIAHGMAPAVFSNFMYFAKRYCAAYQGRYGWDFTGSSNLDELQEKLRVNFMIRRLKAEVLTELPVKRRTVVAIPANGASGVVERERERYEAIEARHEALRVAVELAKASDDDDAYEAAVAALSESLRVAFTEISALRHETAVAKIPHAVEYIEGMLEGGVEKLVVFCHHKDVIAALMEAFRGRAVQVTGDMPIAERQVSVDRFQSDPSVALIFGTYGAMGVGYTLVAASNVLCVELDWVPANVTQAEDRTHRIGQKNAVNVYHLVFDESLDARMAKTIVEKQEIADAALDDLPAKPDFQLIPSAKDFATQNVTRERVAKEAEKLTREQIDAAHACVKIIAGMCDGAETLDDMGFSGVDVAIGHSFANQDRLSAKQGVIAQKLANKYRRQLPVGLVAAALGLTVEEMEAKMAGKRGKRAKADNQQEIEA